MTEQDTLDIDVPEDSAMNKLLAFLEEMDKRQRKIEAQNRKIIRIISDKSGVERDEKKTQLARAVMNSSNGLTTSEVADEFGYSQNKGALELMRDLADDKTVDGDSNQFKVHEKSTPYRIVHRKKHGIGGY